MKRLLLATVACLVPTIAGAASLTAPAVPAPAADATPLARWTGLHIGVGGGLASSSAATDSTSSLDFDCEGPCVYLGSAEYGSRGDVTKRSAFGTVEIGWDFQFDRLVVGLGANYDFASKAKGTARGSSYWSEGDWSASTSSGATVEFGDSWAAVVRLGFLATDRTLVYGLAGYAGQDVKLSASFESWDEDFYGTNTAFGRSERLTGAVFGAGVEQMLTSNLSLKLEYRYADFGKISASRAYQSGNCDCNYFDVKARSSADVTTQSIRAVASYRF